jgi:chromosome segregation ATPase
MENKLTSEEILGKHLKKASPFGTATVSNPIVNKAMIFAMEEYGSLQTEPLQEEVEELKGDIQLMDQLVKNRDEALKEITSELTESRRQVEEYSKDEVVLRRIIKDLEDEIADLKIIGESLEQENKALTEEKETVYWFLEQFKNKLIDLRSDGYYWLRIAPESKNKLESLLKKKGEGE